MEYFGYVQRLLWWMGEIAYGRPEITNEDKYALLSSCWRRKGKFSIFWTYRHGLCRRWQNFIDLWPQEDYMVWFENREHSTISWESLRYGLLSSSAMDRGKLWNYVYFLIFFYCTNTFNQGSCMAFFIIFIFISSLTSSCHWITRENLTMRCVVVAIFELLTCFYSLVFWVNERWC